ncbi:MAG: M50 family metallopeptidase [Dermatophilaceae bacterium]|nr:M50 family metallopeptidase [Intrasporangiaceae bacterium]
MASSERVPREKTPGARVGSIAGVPVFIGWSWLLLAAIITAIIGPSVAEQRPDLGVLAYGVGVLVALGLLLSVLVHEAAHALSALAFGLHVRRIVADLMGGHTAFDGRTTPWSQGLTALAGPVANLLLAGVALVLAMVLDTGVPGYLAEMIAQVNILLALFNLLPGMPLDGGQILLAAVWRLTGSQHRGSVVAGWSGRVVALLVVAGFLLVPIARGGAPGLITVFWVLFIASFLWRGASQSIVVGRTRARIDATPLGEVMRPVTMVPTGGPIASWWTGPDRVYVTQDPQGHPVGIVRADVVASVPQSEWSGVPASAVAVAAPQGWVRDFAESPSLGDVLFAMGQSQLDVLLVGHRGRVEGIVFGADAVRAVE